MLSPVTPTTEVSTRGVGTQANIARIWIVTGPAGSGKSTVAGYLAKSLGMPLVEGDDYHEPSNIEKMRKGYPLTDVERWQWLTLLREESRRLLNSSPAREVVVACSALKRRYRDVIRVAAYYDHSIHIHFIYLQAPESVIRDRVQARQGHYMSAGMVRSQFQDLEPPVDDERDVIRIDVTTSSPDEVSRQALEMILETKARDSNDSNTGTLTEK